MTTLPEGPLPDKDRREEILARIEKLSELPLVILSFVIIPLLVGPLLWDLTPETEDVLFALDIFIWAVFAVDLGARLVVAPHRIAYLRGHWLEALIVAVPFARPLRIARLFLFGSRAFRGTTRLLGLDFLLTYAIGIIVIAATVLTSVEIGHNPAIDSFPDALWLTVVTVTTVGYGDIVPVTIVGKAVAFVLMFGGIALFGALTANLASFLVRIDHSRKAADAPLLQEIAELRRQIVALRESLS